MSMDDGKLNECIFMCMFVCACVYRDIKGQFAETLLHGGQPAHIHKSYLYITQNHLFYF